MQFGNHSYDLEKETRICGILNVTPDSFSDGGKYTTMEAALKKSLSRGLKLVVRKKLLLSVHGS